MKVAKAPEEIEVLLEVGFEYVVEKDDLRAHLILDRKNIGWSLREHNEESKSNSKHANLETFRFSEGLLNAS